MGLNGDAVKELAERTQKPIEFGEVIVAPKDFQFKHKNELAKPQPAFALPKCAVLQVSTLGALRDYLKANRDALAIDTLMVHIETPNRVTVGSRLREPARDRELYITATAVDMTHEFVGAWQELDDFNIGLQVRFQPPIGPNDVGNQRDVLIQMVSSVRTEQSTEATDNGLSQSLEARAGVVMKSHQQLPNPVILTPFRTFRDILQPVSPFVLRAQCDKGELPELCLFEADGGTWKLTAIQRIYDWLKAELGEMNIAILA